MACYEEVDILEDSGPVNYKTLVPMQLPTWEFKEPQMLWSNSLFLQNPKVLCSAFEELAEAMACKSIASAELFVNKMLVEVDHIKAAQLIIKLLPNQDEFQVETKVGSDKASRQVRKKTKANTNIVNELLHSIQKSISILEFIQLDSAV